MNEDKEQNTLAAYVKTSATSKAAAESMQGASRTLRARVLHYLIEQGRRGATDYEIEQALSMRHQTASARRRELVLSSEVIASERERETGTGRKATVWVAAEWATPKESMLHAQRERERLTQDVEWTKTSERLPELGRRVPVVSSTGKLQVAYRSNRTTYSGIIVWFNGDGFRRDAPEYWLDINTPEVSE